MVEVTAVVVVGRVVDVVDGTEVVVVGEVIVVVPAVPAVQATSRAKAPNSARLSMSTQRWQIESRSVS